MKFAYALAALVAAAVSVEATETNGKRMALGLGPLPPRRLHGSRTSAAKRTSPSGAPGGGHCTTGPVQCCNSVHKASTDVGSTILGLLDLVLHPDALIGVQCSPLSVIGVGSGSSCSAHTVCCENNSQGGLISIGCIPIFL